ncbi:MAG: LysE family translocator [Spirochaetes bacterium]|nr:LysE family translocator [Spirochaetota bacterium]
MYTIHIFFLFAFGLFIGFISSIPVGAVQLEVIKKAINGHLKPAISVALGSVTSDFIYGVLVLFGIGGFLHYPNVQIFTYSLGILVIIALLYRSYREHKHIPPHIKTHIQYKKRTSFLTGFTIAITNPGMIVWWVIGYKLLIDLELFQTMTIPLKATFLVACCTGLAGYLTLIAFMMNKLQESISDRLLDKMNIVIMILLVFVIIYFAFKLYGLITNTNVDIMYNF